MGSSKRGHNTGKPGSPGWQKTDKSKSAGKTPPSASSFSREGTSESSPSPEDTAAHLYDTYKVFSAEQRALPLDFPSSAGEDRGVPSRHMLEETERESEKQEETLMDRLRAGQAPLILTAREIRENFQAIDGDRSEEDNEKISDDALFARKLAESDYRDPDGETIDWDDIDEDDLYEDDDGNRIVPEKWSLVDDIKFNGIIYPVTLQENPDEVGSQGKPEILGGHHRIAVMQEHAPDEFIPVEFYPDHEAARKGLGWKY